MKKIIRNQYSILPITDEEAISLLENNWSLSKISKVYNICSNSLSKRLKKKSYIIINKQNERGTNHNVFETIDTEEKAYWLGFLYADGSIHSKTNQIELSLKESDFSHLEKFKLFIGAQNKIIYREKTKSYRYCFFSKKIRKDLINLGCFPRKTEKLTFPNLTNDLLKLSFIRGYFDGDGCLTYKKTKKDKLYPLIGVIGTENILKNILKFFNLDKNLYLANKKENSSNKIFEFKLGKKDSIYFLEKIYEDSKIHLDRKYNKFFIFKQNNYAVLDKKLLGL